MHSITSFNVASIAHNHYTDIYSLININTYIYVKMSQVAEKFNARPLKPEWLKMALDLGFLQPIVAVELEAPTVAEKSGSDGNDKGKGKQKEVKILDGKMTLASPKSVASFLRSAPGIGKPEVGEFISKGPADSHPFYAAVLREYCDTFEFPPQQMGFSQALRTFLGCFRMPGEAQSIDRYVLIWS